MKKLSFKKQLERSGQARTFLEAIPRRPGSKVQAFVYVGNPKTRGGKMPTKAPPVSQLWLQKQFDEIDLQFAIVRNLIKELKNQNILILAEVRKTSGNVSPELEKAILENSARSKGIDAKVPDQNKCK